MKTEITKNKLAFKLENKVIILIHLGMLLSGIVIIVSMFISVEASIVSSIILKTIYGMVSGIILFYMLGATTFEKEKIKTTFKISYIALLIPTVLLIGTAIVVVGNQFSSVSDYIIVLILSIVFDIGYLVYGMLSTRYLVNTIGNSLSTDSVDILVNYKKKDFFLGILYMIIPMLLSVIIFVIILISIIRSFQLAVFILGIIFLIFVVCILSGISYLVMVHLISRRVVIGNYKISSISGFNLFRRLTGYLFLNTITFSIYGILRFNHVIDGVLSEFEFECIEKN